jgi:hypothetical protein
MSVIWHQAGGLEPRGYICSYCGHRVGPSQGYHSTNQPPCRIYICSYCGKPTFFESPNEQYPGPPFGNDVASLPPDVGALYTEARRCMTVNTFTSAVLTCRKLLMHIAVAKGAPAGKSFLEYVEFLADKHYVPPDGMGWVDHIRKKGNEANHEIKVMSRDDAKDLIEFSEMLLKIVYEFPAKVKPPVGP